MAVSDRLAHRAFLVGIVFKGLDGLLEVLGAIAVLFITQSSIDRWAGALAHLEVGGGFAHAVASHVVHAAHHLSTGTRRFAVIYLFAHGAIKLVLVAGLLREVRWVFPVALVVLTGFIGYQLYRLSIGVSWLLVALTVIDAIVVALIWHEWRSTSGKSSPYRQARRD